MASVTPVPSLVTFTPLSTALSADVNSNFTLIRTQFNNLVTATNTIAVDSIGPNANASVAFTATIGPSADNTYDIGTALLRPAKIYAGSFDVRAVGNGTEPGIYAYHAEGTIGAPTAPVNGSGLGFYRSGGYISAAYVQAGWVRWRASQDWAVGANGSYIEVATIHTGQSSVSVDWVWRDGHFFANADNTYDIGSGDGGTTLARPRDVYVGRSIILANASSAVGAGKLAVGGTTQATVGAAGGASAQPATPLGYILAYLGATKIAIPYHNAA